MSSPGTAAVVGVVFGYLFGTVLRLLRTQWDDQLSAWWIRTFHASRRLFTLGSFPYAIPMRRRCRDALPRRVCGFYDRVWAPPPRRKGNLFAFDFFKTLIAASDSAAALEIAAAEALSRFVSGMFYALVLSVGLVVLTDAAVALKERNLHSGLTMLGPPTSLLSGPFSAISDTYVLTKPRKSSRSLTRTGGFSSGTTWLFW